MQITDHGDYVVIGDPNNQEALDKLVALATQTRGVCTGATAMPDGTVVYGADWMSDSEFGLGDRPNTDIPENKLIRVQVPHTLPLVIGKPTWDYLNGLPELPCGDACLLELIGIKCYYSGTPIRCVTSARFEPQRPQRGMLNAHFVHSAYFSDIVYYNVWAPMLYVKGYSPEIEAILQSPQRKAEWEWLEANRRENEDIFFRKALLKHIKESFDIDEGKGTAVPRSLAEYVGYEARRSPGREWKWDKSRLGRHIDDLFMFMSKANMNSTTAKLLDIGSRDGWALSQMFQRGMSYDNLNGMEISPWSATHARSQGRPVHQGDAHDLSRWGDNQFDAITFWHCLEHCHTPTQVLAGIHRILKPSGFLMLVVPIEDTGLSIKGDHCFAMRSNEFVVKLLLDSGFKLAAYGTPGSKEFVGFFRPQSK